MDMTLSVYVASLTVSNFTHLHISHPHTYSPLSEMLVLIVRKDRSNKKKEKRNVRDRWKSFLYFHFPTLQNVLNLKFKRNKFASVVLSLHVECPFKFFTRVWTLQTHFAYRISSLRIWHMWHSLTLAISSHESFKHFNINF